MRLLLLLSLMFSQQQVTDQNFYGTIFSGMHLVRVTADWSENNKQEFYQGKFIVTGDSSYHKIMDKFKIKILPNKKVILSICSNILSMAIIIGIMMFIYSCSDDVFIAGYNKDMEDINQQIFEVDSLLKTIYMELDSLNTKAH